jgi:hypothetical protein
MTTDTRDDNRRGEQERADGGPSSEAIRADIERTRERLGETVEALGTQLNPSHLKQRVKESVREATIGRVRHMASNTKERISETGRGLAHTIRENPVPAAMAAAGIGWLLFSSRDQQRTGGRSFNAGSFDQASRTGDEAGMAHRIADSTRDVADRVSSGAQNLAHDVAEKAQEAKERVTETAQEARERVARKATLTGRRMGREYNESPLAIGAVALAVGLAVALALPTSEKEVELMGDARDKLVDKAREQVSETTEKVERVVERAVPEVQSVIRDAAREEGFVG